jgi:hypothetical protein
MAATGKNIYSLADFQIGTLEDTHLALMLNYATSEENHHRKEFEAFVIAIDRDFAVELGNALIRRAQEPICPGSVLTRQ